MRAEQPPLFAHPSEEEQPTPLNARTPLVRAQAAFHEHMLNQDMSPHTIRAFDSDLRILAQHIGEDAPIGRITTSRLETFLRYLRNQRRVPCKPKSLARRITTLKVFFSWLADEQVIDTDPALALVHYPVSTPLPQVLSDDQVEQLLIATRSWGQQAQPPDPRPHLLVSLLLETGIKKAECMGIALNDIDASDPANPTVFIRYPNIKQRYKERKLRLPVDFPVWLAAYREQYRPKNNLFECTPRNLEYVLDACNLRAGLPPRTLSFEVLRWTAALRDFRSEMDADDLRRKLGLSRITWAETLEKLQRLDQPAL